MNVASRYIEAHDAEGKLYRYRTEGEGPLGAGTFAQAWLARRLPADTGEEEMAADDARWVALKISNTPKWKGFLDNEARLLRRLESEVASRLPASQVYRIVRIGAEGKLLTAPNARGGTDAILELEYLDGVTLEQWFGGWKQRQHITPDEILGEVFRVAQELAEALVQLSLAGEQVHRDVKPANIMRTSQGLRLFDFNVARAVDPAGMTQHVGSAQYMAPEVRLGPSYDHRADLYSVGVILWEIAHQTSFDPFRDVSRSEGGFVLKWPTAVTGRWPSPLAVALRDLLTLLIVDARERPTDAAAFMHIIERLRKPFDAREAESRQLEGMDLIGLLAELRPSGLVSVVTDTTGKVPRQELQDYLRRRMQVDDPLEDWLAREIQSAATARRGLPVLFLLAGNAGDGKSHLLFRLLRHRLKDRPEVLARLRTIADATHALAPDASQRDRLSRFFAPFSDAEPEQDDRVHVIAMNTGMVIRFFEGEAEQRRFPALYRELERQLGLRRGGPENVPWRIEVINLDLRDLLATPRGQSSFFERMLDRLDPEANDGIAAPKWGDCQACPAVSLCPVTFNLRALRIPQPRRALVEILRRVAFDTDIHMSPRNMWGFLYRLITGGVERYAEGRKEGEGYCDVVRARAQKNDGDWLLGGQFTELLYRLPAAGAPWSALARHDPAYSSAPALDRLHTRLSIKTELDNDPEIVEKQLGGSGRKLADLALDRLTALLGTERNIRRDAAVRRQVVFHEETFDAWFRHEATEEFNRLLAAFHAFSKSSSPATLSEAHRGELKRLRDLVQRVFQGHGETIDGRTYLGVSQPNARGQSKLLVQANAGALDQVFQVTRIVTRDVHTLAHAGREALLGLLGYHPNQISLDILGVRISVDHALHEFLVRVGSGQKPSVRDLAQFQSLLFIGDRIGNELAGGEGRTDQTLFVSDGHALHRLFSDDFGHPQIERAR